MPIESNKKDDFLYKLPPLIAAIKCPKIVLAISALNITGTLPVGNFCGFKRDSVSLAASAPTIAGASNKSNFLLTV